MKNLFSQKPYGARLTIPNLITFVGILLLIPYIWGFLANGNRWVMFGALFLAGCSDLFDGLFARLLKQRTRIGEILDPLRDRMICGAVLGNMLYLGGRQLAILVAIIVAIELAISFVNFHRYCRGGLEINVHLVGKLRQAGHLLACGLVIISFYFKDVIYALLGFEFHFSLSMALSFMIFLSFLALVFYKSQDQK